jgi:hypothetical protein
MSEKQSPVAKAQLGLQPVAGIRKRQAPSGRTIIDAAEARQRHAPDLFDLPEC